MTKILFKGFIFLLLTKLISSQDSFQNILDKAESLRSRQVIIVTASDADSSFADLFTFEKKNNSWIPVFEMMKARIGRNGISSEKKEGDGKSPQGIFGFDFFFGSEDNPGFKFKYVKVDSNDCWVDDSESEFYNTMQKKPANSRWNSAEDILISDYKFAAVINYNTKERIPNKGSAIFLHITNDKGTSGCTVLTEENLLKVLLWLDPKSSPLIIQGDKNYLR